MAFGQESSLKADGAIVVDASSPGSIPNPYWSAGWSWVKCNCYRDPPVRLKSNSADFCSAKSQLLCGVRIELAIGSLPNLRQSGAPTVW